MKLTALFLLLVAGLGVQGFREDFVRQLDEIQSKTVALARAIPAERYTWRPGPGVRSVSELMMHVTGSNFLYAMFLGVPVPSDVPSGRDPARWESSTTDREKIVSWLDQSFEQMRKAAAKAAETDLGLI